MIEEMDENQLVRILPEKCKICYSCVRVCPVKAIVVKADQDFPEIMPGRCIGCGSCLAVCAPGAIVYRDSREAVRTLLASDRQVVAIVDPSISGEFWDITDYKKFVRMIQALGFRSVHEISFGVDMIARKYSELFGDFRGRYYISSNCPPVVYLVEKYFPALVGNLVPLVSPMAATAMAVHQQYGEETSVVAISPCIAAKEEAAGLEGGSSVDAVLTFVELRQLFSEFNIIESNLEFSDFNPPFGYKGSLYPLSNGFVQAMEADEDLLSSEIITEEGKNNVLNAVREFDTGIEQISCHFNLFYCEGCLMGPGTSPGGKKLHRRTLVTRYANKRLRGFDLGAWKQSLDSTADFNYERTFMADDQRMDPPPGEKLQEVLNIIGKVQDIDNAGCEACGYASCHDFAEAVAQGIAKTEMCASYALKSKQEYIKALRTANDRLTRAQEELKESEKTARAEQMAALEARERTTAMLQKLPAAVVIVDEKLRVIESNQAFITLLGEEAAEINEIIPGLAGADLKTLLPVPFYKLFANVFASEENVLNKDVEFRDGLLNVSIFTIRKNKIVGAVLRDMYVPEVQKEQVVKRVNDVIDENLGLVQQIAFLLGEGASKTEKMLNSIIQTYKDTRK